MTQLSVPLLIMAQHPRSRQQDRLRVRRVLFEERVDHELTRRTLQRELIKIQREDARRWNFNFAEEKPLDGRYEWTKVETDCPDLRSRTTPSSVGPIAGASESPTCATATSSTPAEAPANTATNAATTTTTTASEEVAGASTAQRQSTLTDFFVRRRKRSASTKSTNSTTTTEKMAKLS